MGTRTDRSPLVDGTPPSVPSEHPTGTADQGADVTPVVPDAAPIPSTRAGRTWIRVLPALVLLTVTVVFVLQNLRPAKVSFITASGRLPIGLALLIAAAFGALVVLALGSVRIIQLRHLVHRTSRHPRRGDD
jgi:uncharacterized integral membrane protein